MTLLEEALAAPGCVLSVMGAHAGEDADEIFRRKIADCASLGFTFWVAKSAKARPRPVQTLCTSGGKYVVFIEPATSGGTRPTMESTRAREYSEDGVRWSTFPDGMGPVTGQMDRTAVALVLADLTIEVRGAIDLWKYADWSNASGPVRFALGVSTICAVRQDTSGCSSRMKSRLRAAVAVARLVEPYCAWVR